MTTLKGYYKDGVITVNDGDYELKNGPVEITIRQTPKLSEKLSKYKGAIKVYGDTKAVQEYIKDCRSE